MPDIPGDSSTTSTIAVGQSLVGSLEVAGDRDWFRITLTQGQEITVALTAITLADPYLRIRDSNGNILYENDDISTGRNLNSLVSFMATYTGVYYIDVGAWNDGYAGDYQLSVTNYSPPAVATNDQIADQLVSGYWFGDVHRFNVSEGGQITVNITGLTAAGQNLARNALALWSDIIGVRFVEVSSGGQIVIDDNQSGASARASWSGGFITSATVNISTQWLTDYGTGLNSYSFQTYIHEIGHALGLGHAGNYNGDARYPYDALFANDAWTTSIMSYFDQRENSHFAGQSFSFGYAVTPMVADILAMSSLYGLSTTTRLGDTVYGFNSNSGRDIFNASLYPSVTYTIFDSGGNDTLDYSGFAQNQVINLNPETFSSVGARIGNVSIARGTIIENAIGGSGSDRIIGNSAANRLEGRGGNDTIDGGAGNDILIGGAGADILTGGAGNDIFRGTAAEMSGDTITDFAIGDAIHFTDASLGSFTYSLSGTTLIFTGGSLTLAAPLLGTLAARAATGGGVELYIQASVGIRDVRNDFNGDGRSDILFRHDNGAIFNFLGTANGGVVNNGNNLYTVIGVEWTVAGIGDFNGDGRDDILLRNVDGAIFNYLSTASGGIVNNGDNSYSNVSATWTLSGVGDFNGDGRDDILWRLPDGTLVNWLGQANGGFLSNHANLYTTIGLQWQVAGIGDFNGDGRSDILLRDNNGAIFNLLGTTTGGVINNGDNIYTVVANSWQVAGIGDFNGDGRDDILWRNANGDIFDFLSTANGGIVNNGDNSYSATNSTWNVAGIGDYNGDGRDDILWRMPDGTVTNWLGQGNGGFVSNHANLFTTVGNEWHVQSPDLLGG